MNRAVAIRVAALLWTAWPAAAQTTADQTKAPEWQALQSFVGAYPTGSEGKPALLGDKLVREELATLLTPAERARLDSYAVSPPVAAVSGDLLAQFCLPHECGAQSAVLVIDPDGKNIWVGFYRTDGKTYQTDWTGTADPASMPAGIWAALANIHDPF